MIRVIQIAGDGSAIESTGIDALKNCHEGVLCWIDLEAFDENELRLLQQRFGLHPLAIQDCTDAQRAKLTEYDNYLFMILNSMSLPNPLKTPKFAELAVFLGNAFPAHRGSGKDRRR
jgi:magnesium transporter